MSILQPQSPWQWAARISDREGRPTPEFLAWINIGIGNDDATVDQVGGKQDASPNLDGVTNITGTGLVAFNAGSFFTRTLTPPAAGITVSNGNGVAGNPTLALTNDLAALEALTGTDTIYYRSGVDTWTEVTIGAGLSFVGGTLEATDTGSAGVLPMVDGSIPAVFLQNPDGSLIYTEI